MIMLITLCISIIVYVYILKHFLGPCNIKGVINIVLFGMLSFSMHGILFIISTLLGISWTLVVILLLIIAMVFLIKIKNQIFSTFPKKLFVSTYTIIFSFVTLYGIYLFKIYSVKYGRWDAFAIWNLHARFLADADLWDKMLDPSLSWSHNEYPLLFPSYTAMFWRFMDTCNPYIPMVGSFLIFIALLFILYKSASGKFGKMLSLLATMLIVTNNDIIVKVSSQYADSIVALFYLATLFIFYKIRKEDKKAFILLGIFASINCWIKNEGLIFFILVSIGVFLYQLKHFKNVLNYLYGAIPLFLIHIAYGVLYPTQNDLYSTSYEQLIGFVQNFSRYQIIFNKVEALINIEFTFLPICFFICLFLLKKNIVKELPLLIMLTLLIAYCSFFVITPFDISWHLDTALDRLILQCYPSILMITVIVISRHYNKLNFSIK